MQINMCIEYEDGYFSRVLISSPGNRFRQQIVRQKLRALSQRDTNHNSKVVKRTSLRPR